MMGRRLPNGWVADLVEGLRVNSRRGGAFGFDISGATPRLQHVPGRVSKLRIVGEPGSEEEHIEKIWSDVEAKFGGVFWA